MSTSPSTPTKRIKFAKSDSFRATLKERVEGYLEEQNIKPSDDARLYLKTLILFTVISFSYYILVFTETSIWGKVIAAIIFGLAGAGIGFNVMHDAGHNAMSSRSWVNRVFFYSLDLLGGSSYFWNIKHNQLHHTYANIDGYDDDIDVGALMRLSPKQAHRSFHRLQHFYIWPLYGLIVPKWQIVDDFVTWKTGKITEQTVPRPRGGAALALILGKVWFFGMYLILPMFFYSPLWVIAFYLLASWVQGFALAVTFQLAHCLEEADFPTPDQAVEADWARHQVLTTVDFAPHNKFVTWYIGGLNYQVIHHLFPRISHVHYPKLAPIVAQTCEEFGLEYKVHQTVWGGLKSHYRHLKRLGSTPEVY